LIYVAAIALGVLGVAFFSGSETAFVSCDRFRMMGAARCGVRGGSAAVWLLARPITFVSMVVVGTNICVVLASTLATDLLYRVLGEYAVAVSTAVMTAVILVVGEVVPKAAARANPQRFMAVAGPGLVVAYYVLYPVAKGIEGIASLVTAFSGSHERTSAVTRDEIRGLVKEAAQMGVGLAAEGYAHRALDLSSAKVVGAMLPMEDVISIDAEATVDQALRLAAASGHSRYPLYGRIREDPVGVLHVKDLLGAPAYSRVKAFARPVHFVPETATMRQAILEMRYELRHLAVVSDEYGRAIGIITFEDLVEEIVGDISDEYDREKAADIGLGKVIGGSTHITVINEELGVSIPEGAYTTVAGFILSRLGSIPRAGDSVTHNGFLLEVVEMRGRRIRSVRITSQERGT
jgi:putative hemolysin